jgi:hypothetical protein
VFSHHYRRGKRRATKEFDVVANIVTVPAGQGKVFDIADPARLGKVIKAGAEVSEVRFDDDVARLVPNVHLRTVPAPSYRLAKPTENTEEDIIQRGQAAWDRLRGNSTFADWVYVGTAHVLGRAAAMHDARTNKPQGRGYNAAFAAWARKFGFADLDKGDRSRLFAVMDNLKEIGPWLEKLPLKERLRLNHPNSIWRRWKATTTAPKADAEPKASPMQKLKDALVDVIEERDRYKREVERGGGDLWVAEDRPRDIADVIFRKVGKAKAEKIARELLNAVKASK